MTLLKRKSALWHGRAILLLDWVSGPLKTGAAQFSPSKKKKNTSKRDSGSFDYLGEAWETEGWERGGSREGGGAGGIQPVPIVATVQLHLSQQQRDYFLQSLRDAAGQTSETPARRK